MKLFRVVVLAFGVGTFCYHIPADDAQTARKIALNRTLNTAGALEIRIYAVQEVESLCA